MDEEREVLIKALSSFALYRPSLHSANQLRRTDYISLSQSHKDLIPHYLKTLELVDDAIESNAILVETMLQDGSETMLEEPWSKSLQTIPSQGDLEKTRGMVRQIVRDWSAEGAKERELTYTPLLRALEQQYPESCDRSKISVLTPGCGLARLSFEIARLGFASVGNEFSFHMLVASNYLLNHTRQVNQYVLHPFMHSFSNHKLRKDMLRSVRIPDVVPSAVLNNASFAMATGEFNESFGGLDCASTFDCIVTCFFLDTAHNVIEYIETIKNLLKDDGIWLNLGPCLWHHEHGHGRDGKSAFDAEGNYVGSIEMSMEEVMDLVIRMGFSIEQTDVISTPYMGNDSSMLEHIYHAQFFQARCTKESERLPECVYAE